MNPEIESNRDHKLLLRPLNQRERARGDIEAFSEALGSLIAQCRELFTFRQTKHVGGDTWDTSPRCSEFLNRSTEKYEKIAFDTY